MGLYFPLTGSVNVSNTDDLIRESSNSIKILVGGSKNTRLMDVDKGLGIRKYIFENTLNTNVISGDIKGIIEQYVTGVKVEEVTVVKNKVDGNMVNVVIKWYIPYVTNADSVQTTIINGVRLK